MTKMMTGVGWLVGRVCAQGGKERGEKAKAKNGLRQNA